MRKLLTDKILLCVVYGENSFQTIRGFFLGVTLKFLDKTFFCNFEAHKEYTLILQLEIRNTYMIKNNLDFE